MSSGAQGDYSHHSRSLPHILENLQPSEGNISSSTDAKDEQSNEEMQLPPQAPQNPAVLNGPNYSLGILSQVGNQLVQLEGHEAPSHETRVPNFVVSCSILLLTRSFGFVIFF